MNRWNNTIKEGEDETQGNDLTGELGVASSRAAELRADLARLADQAADLAAAPAARAAKAERARERGRRAGTRKRSGLDRHEEVLAEHFREGV